VIHRKSHSNRRFFLLFMTTGLKLILTCFSRHIFFLTLVHVSIQPSYPSYTSKTVISGQPSFNGTSWMSITIPDFARRTLIEDFILAPLAPYRIFSTNDHMIDCSATNCTAYRIHDNLQYTIVPPANWTESSPALPQSQPEWMEEFDATHPDWTMFAVQNASTIQIEIASFPSTTVFDDDDCVYYGFPYLSLRICMIQVGQPNILVLGTLLIE
jgi:hypothetical protein